MTTPDTRTAVGLALTPDRPPLEFVHFYVRSFPVVCRTLTTLTDDSRAVDDAVQDAFLLAKSRWDKVGGYDKPIAWVIKVALRLLRRYQGKRSEQSLHTVDPDVVLRPVMDHAEYVVQDEQLRAVVRVLPRRRAEVVVLHDLLGYPTEDVAAILRITPSTVRSHLALAHEQLRALLDSTEGSGPWASKNG